MTDDRPIVERCFRWEGYDTDRGGKQYSLLCPCGDDILAHVYNEYGQNDWVYRIEDTDIEGREEDLWVAVAKVEEHFAAQLKNCRTDIENVR